MHNPCTWNTRKSLGVSQRDLGAARLGEDGGELAEPAVVDGERPADEADGAGGLGGGEAGQAEVGRGGAFGPGGELGQERQAEALGDEAAERGQARGAQVHAGPGAVDGAGGEGLVGQAVAVVEEEELLGLHVLGPERRPTGAERGEAGGAAGEEEAVLEERRRHEVGAPRPAGR